MVDQKSSRIRILNDFYQTAKSKNGLDYIYIPRSNLISTSDPLTKPSASGSRPEL